MKKIIFLLTAAVALTFCKGPGSGPLVKDSFNKKEETKANGRRETSGKGNNFKGRRKD